MMIEINIPKSIEAEASNPVPRLVHADWLDEQVDLPGELLWRQSTTEPSQWPK